MTDLEVFLLHLMFFAPQQRRGQSFTAEENDETKKFKRGLATG